MNRLLLALLFVSPLLGGCTRPTPAVAETPPPTAEMRKQVVNPAYQRWAGFKTGTAVTYRAVTGAEGEKGVTTTTTTYKLVELTDEQAVVEMSAATKRFDGLRTNNPSERLTNPRLILVPLGVSKDVFGKPSGAADQGDEVVTVGGRSYMARRQKSKSSNEAGEVFGTVWTSDEVPGGLVKSVTHTPSIGKTTTTELVEVVIP